jgi:hypothetical protein
MADLAVPLEDIIVHLVTIAKLKEDVAVSLEALVLAVQYNERRQSRTYRLKLYF